MSTKTVVKKTVSLTLGLSFLVMSVTGLMLFIVPKGKVAYWADWKMFGLTKEQYGDLHTTSMVLFLVITVWHIYYNWSPLIGYIKNSAKQITLFKREFVIAFLVNLSFVAGTLLALPPFQTVVDFGSDIKAYWEKTYGSPPYGHAEESSLQEFSQRIGQSAQKSVALLKGKGITVEKKSDSLKQIARDNSVSPQDIYNVIRPASSGSGKEVTFLGRRTLGELAGMQKIDLEKSIKYLHEKGFDATEESRMREAANTLGQTPYELFENLKASGLPLLQTVE